MFKIRIYLTNAYLASLDVAVVTASHVGLTRLGSGRWGHSPFEEVSTGHATSVFAGVLMLWIGYSIYFGLYRSRRLDSPLADLIVLFKTGLATWATGGLLSGLLPTVAVEQVLTARFVATSFVALTLARSLLRVSLRELRRRGYDVKRVLVVASEENGHKIERRINQRSHYGYRIVKRLVVRNDAEEMDTILVARVRQHLASDQVDDVILALPYRANSLGVELVSECENHGVNVRIVPDLLPLIPTDTQIYDFDGVPLVNARPYPTDYLGYAVLKRVFDVCLSLLVLTAFAPLFLVLSVLVKATSEGPVFFTQDRVGMNGKRFRIIKFRTMRQTPYLDPESHWTVDNDVHVTTVGRWLRRTNLDELPQFLNVLKGDMSVVGPRPERPFFLDRFRQEVPEYMVRHYVKSGITGWAQVNGWRGDTAIPERVAHDLYYIRNWAVSLDIKIVLLTLARTFFPSVPVSEKSGSVRS